MDSLTVTCVPSCFITLLENCGYCSLVGSSYRKNRSHWWNEALCLFGYLKKKEKYPIDFKVCLYSCDNPGSVLCVFVSPKSEYSALTPGGLGWIC